MSDFSFIVPHRAFGLLRSMSFGDTNKRGTIAQLRHCIARVDGSLCVSGKTARQRSGQGTAGNSSTQALLPLLLSRGFRRVPPGSWNTGAPVRSAATDVNHPPGSGITLQEVGSPSRKWDHPPGSGIDQTEPRTSARGYVATKIARPAPGRLLKALRTSGSHGGRDATGRHKRAVMGEQSHLLGEVRELGRVCDRDANAAASFEKVAAGACGDRFSGRAVRRA
jgi:hypothetical protein